MTAYLLKSYMRAALRRLTLHPSLAFRWRPSTENCRADIPTNGSPAGVKSTAPPRHSRLSIRTSSAVAVPRRIQRKGQNE
nr:MAG TPA: hypothetical protein [Caudoviricetes sp.]